MSASGDSFDVIAVGGGGSGLAAAIEACAAGARVLLIEKNNTLGGSTAWSIGSITEHVRDVAGDQIFGDELGALHFRHHYSSHDF